MTYNEIRDSIRLRITEYVHGKRHSHTLAVEKECLSLAKLFSLNEDETQQLCIAALLHDITKEKNPQQQFDLCKELGIPLRGSDKAYAKLLHAQTAAALIKRDFKGCDTELIINAVRYHTVGRENMTLTEKLLYLADYIEATRTFEDCIQLRKYFYDKITQNMSRDDLMRHLDSTLILSYDMTIRNLLDSGQTVFVDTITSRNYLVANQSRQS